MDGSVTTIALAAVAVFVAWKLVQGVFKFLSMAAILIIALVIYTGGIS